MSLVLFENPIAEAFQAEAVVSCACDKKPIVASYGAGPCVIMSAYEPHQKVGFVAHFSHFGEVAPGRVNIEGMLSKFLNNRKGIFVVDLKGGIKNHAISLKIIKEVEKWAKTTKTHGLLIRSFDLLDSENDESRSVSLDTRFGTIKTYDPLKDNPLNHRKLKVSDILWAKRSYEVAPQLRIAYPAA